MSDTISPLETLKDNIENEEHHLNTEAFVIWEFFDIIKNNHNPAERTGLTTKEYFEGLKAALQNYVREIEIILKELEN